MKRNEVIENIRAGIWDAHYGKGLSAEYARSVDEQLDRLTAQAELHDELVEALGPFAKCEMVGSLDPRDCLALQATGWANTPKLKDYFCNGCKARRLLKRAGKVVE